MCYVFKSFADIFYFKMLISTKTGIGVLRARSYDNYYFYIKLKNYQI